MHMPPAVTFGGQSAVLLSKAENVRNVNSSFHGCVICGGGQSAVIPSKAENVRNVNGSSHGCVIWGGVNQQ